MAFTENKEFNKFFVSNIMKIHRDMKDEYKDDLNPEDFDLYFRIGMLKFRGFEETEIQENYNENDEYGEEGDEIEDEMSALVRQWDEALGVNDL